MALFRHTASGTTPGEVWSFTMHTEGLLSVGDANQAFADGLTAAWAAGGMIDVTTADVDLTLASTAEIDPLTDLQLTRSELVMALTGDEAGEMLPFQVAVVISLLTNVANRHGRGRFYLPPLATGTVDTGRLSAAAIGILDVAWTAFFDSINTDGLQPQVRNRTAHTSIPVSTARVGNVFDTQRRRRNKLTETYTVIAVP
jgi:hypothetical protein